MRNNTPPLIKRRGGRHHNLRERERILQEYHRSGLPQREFATRKRIGLSTLQLWLRREPVKSCTPDQGPLDHQPGSFLEVAWPVPELASASGTGFLGEQYEILFADQTRLRLPGSFCPVKARQLLEMMRQTGSDPGKSAIH